jgi:polysaccharide export outer membrane protein
MNCQTVWRASIGGLFMMLAACAGNPVAPAGGSAAPKEAAEYHIGAGDQLNIFVWNHPELSVIVPVRPDGLITTPLVEKLGAAGKTPSQLSRDLEVALAEYVRSPKVNVMVTQFVGAYGDQIRVVGQAAKPQSLPYRANMTLLDAMIQVGGLAEFAAGNRARIVRQVNGQSVTIPLRLKDLLNDGDTSKNMELKPGDVIIIPETRF